MKTFDTRLRGLHAKAVESIMSRAVSAPKLSKIQRNLTKKGENITTYIRKFQVDRENLNLAKRILLCDSDHDHQKYKREWKKTQKFLKVRANFKPNICNEQPRIFKYEPILGFGKMFISINFIKIESNLINFREENTYQLTIPFKTHKIKNTFTLKTLGGLVVAFHIPRNLRNKKLWCYIHEIKQNNVYKKGKFWIKPSAIGDQMSSIMSQTSKNLGSIAFNTKLKGTKQLKPNQIISLTSQLPKNHPGSKSNLKKIEKLSNSQQQRENFELTNDKIGGRDTSQAC